MFKINATPKLNTIILSIHLAPGLRYIARTSFGRVWTGFYFVGFLAE